ncbi:MAG TPA: hypothetical protein VFB79_09850 [Candidatus Angelobacter sp.]|nr:hypothetical protein [Candidatus Angelobacter sp.]
MKHAALIALLFLCSIIASADPVRGVVRNSTTNKPSVGDEVTLKRIGNGMEDVAKIKTNARGEFSFDVPASQNPYVIWVQHQGVTYTQVAMPGSGIVAVRVFDSSSNVKQITLAEHAIALQTNEDGSTLNGEEFYTVLNQSMPPTTLTGQHTFEFYLPEGATIAESSVQTGKTQLKATVVPSGTDKNKYAFVFPIRPGQTMFHILYTVPYSGTLKFDPKSDLPTETLLVAAPDSIKFSATDNSIYQNKANPQFKNVNFFIAKNVSKQQKAAFEIAGRGEMPREEASSAPQGGAQGNGDPSRPGGGLGVPNDSPDPMNMGQGSGFLGARTGQFLFLGVLTLFLGAGAVYVYTANQKTVLAQGPQQKSQGRSGNLLDALKEEVFQLEADRLQNKINADDYQTAKAALDKTLQRAVQRQSKEK